MTGSWMFLVTRNRELDWRAILAPGFLIDANDDFQLVTRTAAPAHPQPPTARPLDVPGRAQLTLLYRSRPAGEVLGLPTARDRFGRPIFVVEGMVVDRPVSPPPAMIQAAIEDGLTGLEDLVRAFWQQSDEAAPPQVAPCRPITL
ncbi:hypothetical protein [Frankia sp. QA3]|uniref:hypothetical protein n=1 Tax=Frankia sp. QA3 TaxID=710111 RepID=UPI000269D02B|nr:hypothetical protein [Frankia sp. QA3]EIV95209.1 hypothetical protein FraQA3DRAFT_5016 [Frankia sp. QA3]